MEGTGFQFVCAGCLRTREVLATPEPPEICPDCGLHDPWMGPVAPSRITRRLPDGLLDSPFYLAALGSPGAPDSRPD